jgi:hypothetical protein
MPKLILAASFAAILVVVGCAAPTASSPSASSPAVVETPTPVEPTLVPSPSVTPEPTAAPIAEPTDPPAATPSPKPTPRPRIAFNATEKYLKAGIVHSAIDCRPVRDDLPSRSIGGIECASDNTGIARIGFYLFGSDQDMLEAYYARIDREGIKIGSGADCYGKGGESEYVPWGDDEPAPYRHACFRNAQGHANYRITLPGSHVYIGMLGRSKDMRVLDDVAFLGSMDTPGFPTLWDQPM